MAHWVDPDETDPDTWRGRGTGPSTRVGGECLSVIERARRTALPYQFEVDVHHSDEVAGEFRTREYTNARVIYNCGVDLERRIKLLTRGILWGDSDVNQRFKAQYRRAGPPTDSIPFDEYSVWARSQYGSIERGEDGVTFVADESAPEEALRTLDWGDLYEPVRQRLAELELVRNPAFARYRLQELDEWEAYRTQFLYDADAFAFGP